MYSAPSHILFYTAYFLVPELSIALNLAVALRVCHHAPSLYYLPNYVAYYYSIARMSTGSLKGST